MATWRPTWRAGAAGGAAGGAVPARPWRAAAGARALHPRPAGAPPAREDSLRAALAEGPATVAALVPRLYGALDPRLVPAAGRSLLAHLRKLEAEGLARPEPGSGAWAAAG
ncbi:hypothetical protein ACFQT2_20865 [Pseudoroseomonas aestuarii]|uniref:hypothetical protein n=1 Tax=Teichococcus aestuarii TaxID=568898 RepID=UPI003618AC2B